MTERVRSGREQVLTELFSACVRGLCRRHPTPAWSIFDSDAMSMVFGHFLLLQSVRLFLVNHQDRLFLGVFSSSIYVMYGNDVL